MPKISIIIPYLKGQAYLEECVTNLEQQKLENYEIIVVNDKDGQDVPKQVMENPHVVVYNAVDEVSQEVIRINLQEQEELRGKKIQEKVQKRLHRAERRRLSVEESAARGEELNIYTEEQLNPDEEELAEEYDEKVEQGYPFGVAACRNIGIEKATGKYVYFIDCDDYVLEGALSRLITLAEEKKALVTTGNKYSCWFKPVSFEFEKAAQETFLEGICPLQGEVMKQRFVEMFSAQHLLIDRQLLIDQKIRFDEEITYYADMRFTVQLLAAAEGSMWADGESIYVWRHRNDKIHLPALCQKKRQKRGREFIESYEKSVGYLKKADPAIRYALDRYLTYFCRSKFPARIKGAQALRYSKALREMPDWKRIIKEFGFLERLELTFVRKGKYRMAKPVVGFNHWRNKKKGFFGSSIQWYRFIEKKVFNKMPVRKDWIMLESFFGKSYSDSPKYLYEYLQKTRGDQYRYIWVMQQKSPALQKTGKHTTCKMNSLRYVYYAARCGYRIFNVRQPAWSKKRKSIVFLETWHGTPLKKLAFDLDDLHSASQNAKTLFYEHSREWNYLVSANRFSTDVFERCFVYNRDKILEYGYPRNDILYAANKDEIAAEVKRELGIPEGKRVILYAPTWRDDEFYGKGKYKFSLAMDLDRMRREFSADSVILLRTHYYIADILDLSEYAGFVYNGSRYEDISRLYLASDICITDYSSVFFDYANLKRPILFFAYDFDKYKDELRGFYIDMEKELPGPILKTNDEVVEALHHMDSVTEQYKERYDEFYERFCSVDDGHASERIIEKVFGERETMQ